MRVTCTWSFHISAVPPTSCVADEVESVMEHLVWLEESDGRLHDSAVGLDANRMVVEIGLSTDADTFEEGVGLAMAAIRTAIHATGGSTPDWPEARQVIPETEARINEGLVFERGELVAC